MLAGVRNHHAHAAHGNHGLGDQLDGREQPVDVIRALDQHLVLPAARAARGQETLAVLEVVVEAERVRRIVAHRRGDDFPGRQRGAVMGGNHAQAIEIVLDDHRQEPVARANDL